MSRPSEAGLTGVFGGTFNPVHLGHLHAAEEVCDRLQLRRMIFVPSAQPPLKGGNADPIASAAERLAWVRLAVADNPRFEADDLELAREGPSYSVETLAILAGRLAPDPPVFVIGCDAFADLDAWREPERLLTLSHFAVITRPVCGAPGSDVGADPRASLAEWLPARLAGEFDLEPDGQSGRHRRAGTWIRRLEIAALDVSATEIRRRLEEGRSVRYLLPEAARQAIMASPAYRGKSANRCGSSRKQNAERT
jgi:nicotinate-nucleotide adenylyltransferase